MKINKKKQPLGLKSFVFTVDAIQTQRLVSEIENNNEMVALEQKQASPIHFNQEKLRKTALKRGRSISKQYPAKQPLKNLLPRGSDALIQTDDEAALFKRKDTQGYPKDTYVQMEIPKVNLSLRKNSISLDLKINQSADYINSETVQKKKTEQLKLPKIQLQPKAKNIENPIISAYKERYRQMIVKNNHHLRSVPSDKYEINLKGYLHRLQTEQP